MDSASLDPRLRELTDKTQAPGVSAPTASITAATRPGAVSVAAPPLASSSTPLSDRVQPQSSYEDRQVSPAQQLNRQYAAQQTQIRLQIQTPSQSQPQSQLQAQQAQAQAQARANAQANAHGQSNDRPSANHQTQQQSTLHGPASEQSPADSTSLTPSTPVGASNDSASNHPPPAGDATTPTTDSAQHPSDPNHPDAKKPRACESCRSLKVRCDPDPANPDGPCKRCAKAGRSCVITQPTRKRQKKTDNRVAELEKKIDALTASLQATRSGGSPTVGVVGPAITPARPALATSAVSPASSRAQNDLRPAGGPPARENTGYGAPGNHQDPGSAAREWGMSPREQPPPSTSHYAPSQRPPAYNGMDHDAHTYTTPGSYPSLPPINSTAGQKRKYNEGRESSGDELRQSSSLTPQPRVLSTSAMEQPDIVDRGIITMVQACEFFVRYTDQMSPHLPGVVFPSNMTAAELRRTKPALFLAVMAAASSNIPPLQRTLTNETMRLFAEKVIMAGKKSLELIQALQVAVIWYYPPEHFEELKFYQLLHIAAVMAIDLGLGKKKQPQRGLHKHLPPNWRDHPLKKRPMEDPTSLDARRAWLTCYFLATNASMALHRPNLIRWTPFMAECVDVLESSPDAAPTDSYLCQLIWAHRLAEEVGVQFSMDDPASTPNIAEPRTQYALKGFERELERYIASVPKEKQQPSLRLTFHVLNLYMHEIATQCDFSDDFITSSMENPREGNNPLASDTPLTPAHINALSACLTAVDGIFDVFLSLDVVSIRCLPVFNFVRVAYAVVVLMKIYFAASSPKSELGRVIDKNNMKVEQHLEALLDKFGATAADDRSRPASKFLVVLIMLRSWFQKQKQVGGAGGGPEAGPSSSRHNSANGGERDNSQSVSESMAHAPHQHQQNRGNMNTSSAEYPSNANTPLQLLSEVATNTSNSNPTGPAAPARPGSISDLLSTNNHNPPSNGLSTNYNARNPWTGRPSAFIFDPAGAAEAAAIVNGGSASSSSSTPDNNSGHNNPGTTTTSAAAATSASMSWGVDTTHTPNNNSSAFPTIPLGFDFGDYATMADGFAEAMDLTLGGLTDTDGSFGGVMMGMMGMGFGGGGGGSPFTTGYEGLGATGGAQPAVAAGRYGGSGGLQETTPSPWYLSGAGGAGSGGGGNGGGNGGYNPY